jgi:hypothetical protein
MPVPRSHNDSSQLSQLCTLFIALFKTEQPTVVLTSHARDLPRKARPDMALERDNPAERLARIDKLIAENKPTPAAQHARLQASLMVVSVPQGPALLV